MLNNKILLITGGTGSFGQAFVRYVFTHYPNVKQIRIFSRDEQKQYAMASEFSPSQYPIKYLLGDVRDAARVSHVSQGVDVLIHAAAVKHVPAAEQNPMECIKTNVLGSQNIIDSAFSNNIQQVVALSTDKSANPVNVYGASKLLLDKLFVFADSEKLNPKMKFSVVRYGNIFGSKGSVIPFFLQVQKNGFLPITDNAMTRFSITIQQSIDLVMYAITKGWGGEIIVPIVPSYRITDIAKAIAPDIEHREIGARAGEKLHEEMVTSFESPNTAERDNFYIICPTDSHWGVKQYIEQTNAKALAKNFRYASDTNSQWLSIEDIKQLIQTENML